MIKKYEACFLFKSEELEYKGALEEVKKQLTAFNASDFVENSLGERALEYSIRKQSRGRYEIIEFKMESSNLKELEVQLKLIKNLLRYMILVKINKKVNVKKVKRRNFREFKDNRDTREKESSEATADVKVD
ncbi:SSU ribosomal protein S6P [Borrelia nietonii YOR]|uniref:Small ribosomal subunit protein bS6 n=1 Tax=Borrelia nietonii YOR TaxID=1293576 RepID=A0ABM5PG62_9SPIR|nr:MULTISPECIES: 30S ribosomal protein S6 [Borrelia]AHH03072.1 SSU ribosomal protein S6P [Borrelia nietonii YOR]AHH13616.1 SSU ribosomal protein S6P [Borrelia hermsii MTW]UPA08851.1 30S ribosomal protein S6 [Borrelia nietonii YOR]